MNDQTADVLVVVFTPGMSLRAWEATGMLEREWALYRALAPYVGRIILASFGGAEDRAIASRLPGTPDVVANDAGLDPAMYTAELPARVAELIKTPSRVIVKTNQMAAGRAALAVTRGLRTAGHRVGLVARGGYPWSRFEAYHHGPSSAACLEAGTIERDLCAEAGIVVGTTRTMLDDLAWRYALGPERTRLIPNYVVSDAGATARSSVRDPNLILCAGQLVRRKRVHLLIEALVRLPAEIRSRARLLVVGEGPEEESLRALAASLGAAVEFRPRVPHGVLLDLMSSCAVFAQASEYEGHPKTILEAMSRDAAVLVTEAPGVSDLVRSGITGLKVGDDPATIAEALAEVLEDADWRASMGKAAGDWARTHFALDRIVPLELEAYATALAAAQAVTPSGPMVRFDPELLKGGPAQASKVFGGCIAAFTRKLPPRDQAEFLMRLDTRLYWLHGETAIAANDGLHPKHRVMNYHDFFVGRITPGQRVVDLGSGVGALAMSIATRAGAHVTGIELDPGNLAKADARLAQQAFGRGVSPLSFMQGDITRDRAPGSFDVVVLSNVLEHMTGRVELLRRWREWYGARTFLIRVPALDRDWRVPWKRELGVEWRLDETHETEYTRDQLLSELDEAGLDVREMIANWGEYWVRAEARVTGAGAGTETNTRANLHESAA